MFYTVFIINQKRKTAFCLECFLGSTDLDMKKIRLGLGAFKIGQTNQSSECLLQCLNTKVISVLVTWNVHSLCFRNCLKNIIQNQFQLAQPLLIGRRTKEKQKLAYLGLAQLVSMTFSHTSMIAIWEGVLGDLGVVEFFVT